MRWFASTHDIEIGLSAVRWRRIALPRRGAVGDQDARLMAALEVLRKVHNEMATQSGDTGSAESELAGFRQKHGRNAGR